MDILDSLIQFRKSKKIYKKEMAIYLGITELTIGRYESRQRKIPFDTLLQYANYLGFEVKLIVK